MLEAKGIRSKGLALNTSTDIHIKVSAIKNGSRPKTAEWLEAFAETAFALRSKPKLDNPVKLEFGTPGTSAGSAAAQGREAHYDGHVGGDVG